MRAHHASGIFGAPAARPVTPRESITKSSIDGGLFGGQPAEAARLYTRVTTVLPGEDEPLERLARARLDALAP